MCMYYENRWQKRTQGKFVTLAHKKTREDETSIRKIYDERWLLKYSAESEGMIILCGKKGQSKLTFMQVKNSSKSIQYCGSSKKETHSSSFVRNPTQKEKG